MTTPATELAVRLETIRDRIASAGGDPDRVSIVAVTKGFGADAVRAALAEGLDQLGENYAQELVAKAAAVAELPPGQVATGGPSWHLLGPVQRNKVRSIARLVSIWEAVDRLAAGQAIANHAPGAAVFVQVNTSDDPAKSGCRASDAPALVGELGGLGLDVRGLMTIGPLGSPELARPGFAALSRLADQLGLGERSMGMTDDLEVAVQEGATIVRIGRALFGPRPTGADLRR